MADQNNLPEAEDTKTRVTAKISPATPGKKVPQIDLNTAPAADAKSPVNTMTGRTMKLQGLAGMAPSRPAVDAAPAATAASAAPATPAAPAGGEDTRTRRTVKLSSLASEAVTRTVNLDAPPPVPAAPKPDPAPATAANTVTRRTQKLEALDTQDVVAMTEAAPAVADDTKTRKAAKISAVAAQPSPQAINLGSQSRHTVKVNAIAVPGSSPLAGTPAAPAVPKPAPAPVPEPVPEPRKIDEVPATIQVAAPEDDTKTRAAKKVEPVEAPAQFKAGNVDDTVKLQRPAPKPAMPGSVAPAAQGGAPAVGGIKLNKPKPAAPKPVAKPAPAPEPEKVEENKTEEPKAAEPTGNLGKDQTPPKKKKGLKVNTDAIKDLGSSPAAAAAGAPQTVLGNGAMPVKQVKESVLVNVSFAIFGVFALVVLVFVALVATVDYLNIWKNKSSERIDLPIITDHVYGNIEKKK